MSQDKFRTEYESWKDVKKPSITSVSNEDWSDDSIVKKRDEVKFLTPQEADMKMAYQEFVEILMGKKRSQDLALTIIRVAALIRSPKDVDHLLFQGYFHTGDGVNKDFHWGTLVEALTGELPPEGESSGEDHLRTIEDLADENPAPPAHLSTDASYWDGAFAASKHKDSTNLIRAMLSHIALVMTRATVRAPESNYTYYTKQLLGQLNSMYAPKEMFTLPKLSKAFFEGINSKIQREGTLVMGLHVLCLNKYKEAVDSNPILRPVKDVLLAACLTHLGSCGLAVYHMYFTTAEDLNIDHRELPLHVSSDQTWESLKLIRKFTVEIATRGEGYRLWPWCRYVDDTVYSSLSSSKHVPLLTLFAAIKNEVHPDQKGIWDMYALSRVSAPMKDFAINWAKGLVTTKATPYGEVSNEAQAAINAGRNPDDVLS